MKNLSKKIIVFTVLVLLVALEITASAEITSLKSGFGSYSLPKGENVIDPLVKQDLVSMQDEGQITVIVTLSNQLDLTGIPGAARTAGGKGIIRALQAFSEVEQKQISAYLKSQAAMGNVNNYSSFWIFNGLSVTANSEVITALASRWDVAKITPNEIDLEFVTGSLQLSAEPNLATIRADALWGMGYQGQGVVVASLDSGVDASHPDLAGNWRGGLNSWYDPYGQHPSYPVDLSGHGTWTTGVMVGGSSGGTSIGVAPQAEWIAARIFNDSGSSTSTAIHLTFQWLLDPDGDPNTTDAPQVVNNSWTFSAPGCNLEFELDLQALRAAGILPVFAAGNGGPSSGTSYSPSNNPSAFSVGAIDNSDAIYGYSSRGPTDCGGSSRVFPDVVAPGVGILTTDLYSSYISATGTSLAAPHISGGLALLLSAFSGLSADYQENALIASGTDLGLAGPDNTFGHGRVDLLAAYDWLVSNPVPEPTPDPTINLALNQATLVSSAMTSSSIGEMAVDGDPNTFWQTAKAAGKNKLATEWIQIDLGGEFPIGEVVLDWGSSYATKYSIQVSNDQNNWTTLYDTIAGDGGRDEILFAQTTARYVLMSSSSWANGSSRVVLNEIEVYSGSGGPPIPTPEPTQTPTPTPEPSQSMHIGDLGSSSSPSSSRRWIASVSFLVHDSNEQPIPNVTVSGSWTSGVSGSESCTTDSMGVCTVEKQIRSKITRVEFMVNDLAKIDYAYQPSMNHDLDGNSNGTLIGLVKP